MAAVRTLAQLVGTTAGVAIGAALAAMLYVVWDITVTLLTVAGVLLGWIAGAGASPLSHDERKRFGWVWGVVAAFFTGFLVSKLEPSLGEVFKFDAQTRSMPIIDFIQSMRVLMPAVGFLLAFISAFGLRAYLPSTPLRRATRGESGGVDPKTH